MNKHSRCFNDCLGVIDGRTHLDKQSITVSATVAEHQDSPFHRDIADSESSLPSLWP